MAAHKVMRALPPGGIIYTVRGVGVLRESLGDETRQTWAIRVATWSAWARPARAAGAGVQLLEVCAGGELGAYHSSGGIRKLAV
ncbi:hypothetical protein GCM10012289_33640 [Nonomuraea cavernae]|uniref:Uncharacterized protein n=1 Tax=Nonomuraea cavernae TaxID=2045107 RepID=A0A918DK31_9ACTN|nr:hypothetical protein GCM10012289_33640 [Nonomuraea cavernae]